jgi:hypothetical protein
MLPTVSPVKRYWMSWLANDITEYTSDRTYKTYERINKERLKAFKGKRNEGPQRSLKVVIAVKGKTQISGILRRSGKTESIQRWGDLDIGVFHLLPFCVRI